VRWSTNGQLLVTASIDKNAKVLDSRTGKLIYNKNIEDKGTQSSLV